MSHSNETRLREAYAAFARGDLAAYWSKCDDSFTFHVPGRNQVAGNHRGREAFMAMIGQVMELSGGHSRRPSRPC